MRYFFGHDRKAVCQPLDVKSGEHRLQVVDRTAADTILRPCLHDTIAMTRMRALLVECSIGNLSSLADHDVIEELARQIVLGRLAVIKGGELPRPRMASSAQPIAPPTPT
jgi:hypothetical protein